MSDNQRTTEELHHFSCYKCHKWWTVGDAPEDKQDWYCPWCGEFNQYAITKE